MRRLGVLLLVVLPLCSVCAAQSLAWEHTAIDSDETDAPVAMTGHSMLVRGGAAYVYGGIINWDNGKDVKYGHVLWSFSPEDAAWERCLAERGTRRDNMRLNDSVEVVHRGGWHRARVLAIDDESDHVHVQIEAEPGAKQAATDESPWVPLRSVRYYPPAMNMHAAAIVGNVMYVHGGKGRKARATTDLWAYSFESETWTHLHPKGVAPEPREMHTAVVLDGTVWVYGGSRGQSVLGDLFSYTPRDNTWRRYANPGDGSWPRARWGHVAVACGGRMCVHGGHGESSDAFSDVWAFDPVTRSWENLTPAGEGPRARKGHCAAVWHGSMYIFGGNDRSEFLDDTWAFDFARGTWTPVDVRTRPPARNFHRCVVIKDTLYAFGGNNQGGLVADMWSLRLAP